MVPEVGVFTFYFTNSDYALFSSPFSNLNRRRYAQNDDTLYVAPEDERTDYVRHLPQRHYTQLIALPSHNRQWRTGIVEY